MYSFCLFFLGSCSIPDLETEPWTLISRKRKEIAWNFPSYFSLVILEIWSTKTPKSLNYSTMKPFTFLITTASMTELSIMKSSLNLITVLGVISLAIFGLFILIRILQLRYQHDHWTFQVWRPWKWRNYDFEGKNSLIYWRVYVNNSLKLCLLQEDSDTKSENHSISMIWELIYYTTESIMKLSWLMKRNASRELDLSCSWFKFKRLFKRD